MSRLMRRPRLLLVSVFLLGALLAGSGVVVAATVVKSGKAVTAVKVVTETSEVSISSSVSPAFTWTDVPGMSLSITVPSSQKALLLMTFSSRTLCFDGDGATTFCSLRVLVDGTEALPGNMIFESAASGNSGVAMEATSMQFVAGPLNAGTHTIKVQGMLDEASSTFQFKERTLSVLRSRV